MTDRWISAHVFYAEDVGSLLTDAVAPAVTRLRESGLIDGWFFIRYWQEGPHLRVRLHPSAGVDTGEITGIFEPTVTDHLRRHPSSTALDADSLADVHKQLFLTEYGQQKWNDTYGEDGIMPLRANDSVHYLAYEPEYGRYGGPAGMELAHWHFENSSRRVLELIRDRRTQPRTVLLGTALELFVPMCYAFLDGHRAVAEFCDRYARRWHANYGYGEEFPAAYERGYQRMAPMLADRVAALSDCENARLPAARRDWARHALQLRARVVELATTGRLVVGAEPDQVLPTLLTSYLHMTNNRLGVPVGDESYLGYLLAATAGTLARTRSHGAKREPSPQAIR